MLFTHARPHAKCQSLSLHEKKFVFIYFAFVLLSFEIKNWVCVCVYSVARII